jgi:hypothetical protein
MRRAACSSVSLGRSRNQDTLDLDHVLMRTASNPRPKSGFWLQPSADNMLDDARVAMAVEAIKLYCPHIQASPRVCRREADLEVIRRQLPRGLHIIFRGVDDATDQGSLRLLRAFIAGVTELDRQRLRRQGDANQGAVELSPRQRRTVSCCCLRGMKSGHSRSTFTKGQYDSGGLLVRSNRCCN